LRAKEKGPDRVRPLKSASEVCLAAVDVAVHVLIRAIGACRTARSGRSADDSAAGRADGCTCQSAARAARGSAADGCASKTADRGAADGALAGGVAGCHRKGESAGGKRGNDLLHGGFPVSSGL